MRTSQWIVVSALFACRSNLGPGSFDGSPFADASGDTGDTGALEEPTELEPPPGPSVPACYLGATRDGLTCLDAYPLPASATGYDYPPPFQGSSQYRAPQRFLDLVTSDPQQLLAPNFALGEVTNRNHGRWGVVQSHAIDRLQAVRDVVGAVVVNSGFRSPAYNATLPGSARSSRHLYGDGFDLDPLESALGDVADACAEEGAGYVEVYVSHVHCDWRADPLDLAFFDGERTVPVATIPMRHAEIRRVGPHLEAPARGFDEGEPLREWVAYDPLGNVILAATGPTFEPPTEATRVQVTVGGVIRHIIDL